MAIKRFSLTILMLIVIFLACSKESTKDQEPEYEIDIDNLTFEHSMKGWELYSWPYGNDWNYSILIGTNRFKTYDEVTTNEIIVTGKDRLKSVLNKFPENEIITWIGRGWLESCWTEDYKDLSHPPENIINEIRQYCLANNLVLQVTD